MTLHDDLDEERGGWAWSSAWIRAEVGDGVGAVADAGGADRGAETRRASHEARAAARARDRRLAGAVPGTGEILLVMVLAPANLVATAIAAFLLWFRQMGVAACGPDRRCDLDLLPWSIGVPLVTGIFAVAAIAALAPVFGARGRRIGWIPVLATLLCAVGILSGVALSNTALG